MDNVEAISKVLETGLEIVTPSGVTALKFGSIWVLKDPDKGDLTYNTSLDLARVIIEKINE